MTLKGYICKYYKQEMKEELSETVINILNNYFANHIDLKKFKKIFSLENATFLEILKFILDGDHAYEITKYGYRNYEATRIKPEIPERTSDDYSYDEETRFTKKFK